MESRFNKIKQNDFIFKKEKNMVTPGYKLGTLILGKA